MRFGLRELLFTIILLAVPVASFWFVFKPRNADITQAKSEIASKRKTLDRLNQASLRIKDLNAAIKRGQEAISVIEAKLPAEKSVDEVLRQAADLATQHNLFVKTVAPDKKVPASRYMELPIEWEVSGNFDGFYEFLLDLEQMPRLTQIRDMDIKRSPEQDGSMSATFTLSIYFQPHDDGSGGDGSRMAEVKQ